MEIWALQPNYSSDVIKIDVDDDDDDEDVEEETDYVDALCSVFPAHVPAVKLNQTN